MEIVINVTDENPKPNTALVDPGLNVSTYNKQQIDEKVVSGIAGTITPEMTLTQLNALPDGIYKASKDGVSYQNGLATKPNVLTTFKKVSTVWSIDTEVEMPKSDQSKPSGGHSRITIEGQSNALGVGALSGLVDNAPYNTIGLDWTKPIDRVFIWNPKTGNYENLHIGVNNMASWDADYVNPASTPTPYPTFGPEVGAALSWIKSHEFGNLYIDKNVGDGQQAYWFLKGNSAYYQQKLDRKALADTWLKNRGITVSEDGFIWVQGESDKGTPESEYLFILNQLVSERISDGFIKDTTRIIITQIGTTSGGFSYNVANAKTSYVNSNKKSILVEYPSYYNTDNIHLNYIGQINLGLKSAMYIFYNNIASFNDINVPDSSDDLIKINTDMYQLGVLRNDNVFVADPAAKTIMNIDTKGRSNLRLNGFPSTVGASNVNSYSTVIGIKSTGSVDILEKSVPTSNTEMIDKNYAVSIYDSVSVSWGNYGASAGSTPIIELSGKSDFNEHAERSINLTKNTYRDLETLTGVITIHVISVGGFGFVNVFQFTGGGVLFSGDVVMDKNSDVYDPSKVNTVYAYNEYGVVKCLIEN